MAFNDISDEVYSFLGKLIYEAGYQNRYTAREFLAQQREDDRQKLIDAAEAYNAAAVDFTRATAEGALAGSLMSAAGALTTMSGSLSYVKALATKGGTTGGGAPTTAVSVTLASLAHDTGISNVDGITSDPHLKTAPLKIGKYSYVVDGGQPSDAYDVGALTQGAHTVAVTRSGDGTLTATTTVRFVLDTTPPPALAVTLAHDSGNGSGITGSDGVTNDASLAISGREVDSQLQYSPDGKGWSDAPIPAREGANDYFVRQVDRAGNGGDAARVTFTLDGTAPSALGVALKNDTGASHTDKVTGDATLVFEGQESANLIEYSLDGKVWGVAPVTKEGANAFLVHQVDAAGNAGPGTEISFTLDTTAPGAAPTDGTGKAPTDIPPTDTVPTGTGQAGTGDAGGLTTVKDGATTPGTPLVYAGGAGAGTTLGSNGTPPDLLNTVDGHVDTPATAGNATPVDTLAPGAHVVTQADATGNIAVAASLGFNLDSLAPGAHADTASATGLAAQLVGNVLANDTGASPLHLVSLQFGNGGAIVIPASGTAEIAGAHGTLTIGSDGHYSYQATSAGQDSFVETVQDAAGNTSQTTLGFEVEHALTSAFRFYDTATGGHLLTTSAAEAAGVRASLPSYVAEGTPWTTPDAGTDTLDVFRFYDTKAGGHFYTASVEERDTVLQSAPSYHYEGVAFQAFAAEGAGGSTVLERFFNADTGQHHYALADEANGIRQGSAGAGWIDEGKAFVVALAGHDLML